MMVRRSTARWTWLLALLVARPLWGDISSPAASAAAGEDGRKLLAEWLRAQNAGDFDAYSKLYAKKFAGVRRSGGRVVKLDHAGWLADRGRMFKKPMVVAMDGLAIKAVGQALVADFRQTFSQGKYKDEGPKRMRLVRELGELRISSEELLQSNVTAPAPEPPEQEEETCESTVQNANLRGRDQTDKVSLVICSQKNPTTPDREEAGFVTHANRAQLEVSIKGKKLEFSLLDWEQGWEWGANVAALGVVRLGKTGQEAVVVSQDSYSEGEGIDTSSCELRIIGLDQGELRELWSTTANEVHASIQDGQLRLQTRDHEGWRKNGQERVSSHSLRVVYKDGAFVAR
jgi:hypothetical protein